WQIARLRSRRRWPDEAWRYATSAWLGGWLKLGRWRCRCRTCGSCVAQHTAWAGARSGRRRPRSPASATGLPPTARGKGSVALLLGVERNPRLLVQMTLLTLAL